ncbi:MAG: hypothetical protein HGB11_01485 [Chlorobiales bacterium]|nr:hypothetical protein [Chlorobiales bacterium]
MKHMKLKLLTSFIRVSGNHRAARRAAGALLTMELAGIQWYNPKWYLRNASRIYKRAMTTIRREMRGYQKPVAHVNPNVLICQEFACMRQSEGGCTDGHFTAVCNECCFGVVRNESGQYTSTWLDFNGNSTWIDVGCRDCAHYLKTCKGIDPKYLGNTGTFENGSYEIDLVSLAQGQPR